MSDSEDEVLAAVRRRALEGIGADAATTLALVDKVERLESEKKEEFDIGSGYHRRWMESDVRVRWLEKLLAKVHQLSQPWPDVGAQRRRQAYDNLKLWLAKGNDSRLTTDPNDPALTRGVDAAPVPQAPVYLVLSEAERAKGFVRPVRRTYIHQCPKPQFPLVDLTPDQLDQGRQWQYAKFEKYPEHYALYGKFWTQAQLDWPGCGVATTMAQGLAETYARDPHFYGATYCTGCKKHLPVEEFIWEDGSRVGS